MLTMIHSLTKKRGAEDSDTSDKHYNGMVSIPKPTTVRIACQKFTRQISQLIIFLNQMRYFPKAKMEGRNPPESKDRENQMMSGHYFNHIIFTGIQLKHKNNNYSSVQVSMNLLHRT